MTRDDRGPRRRTVLGASLAALSASAGCASLLDGGNDEDGAGDGGGDVADGAPVAGGAFGALRDGNVVAMAADLSGAAFDPDATATPVQDALDAVAGRGGGRVYLPPTRVTETGPIRPHANTGVVGFGMNVSVVEITAPGTDGVRFDRPSAVQRVVLDGFELRGPGLGGDTGVALHYVDATGDPANDPADVHVGRLYCREWANSVLRVDPGVGPFQCRYDFLRADDCDAGAERALLEWRSSYGPANRFGTVVAYPESRESGAASTVLAQDGGELAVGDLTVGGSAGALVAQRDGRLHLGRAHWEPESQPTTPDALVALAGRGTTRVGDVVVDAGRVPHVYGLGRGFANKFLATPSAVRGRITGNVVHVTHEAAAGTRSWYFGRRADVDVADGVANAGRLRVLGEAGEGVA